MKEVPPDVLTKLLSRPEVIKHVGRDLVREADFGVYILEKLREKFTSIVHAGGSSKEETIVKEFISDIFTESELSVRRSAALLGVCRRTLSN